MKCWNERQRTWVCSLGLAGLFVMGLTPPHTQAQEWCVPPDPDYCVTRVCQKGEGDCDPGQCAAGLTCVNDVGADYGLPAYYDVCETGSSGGADPDYCVNNYCGIGDGDCDPGQCGAGLVCVADVGAEYGLPAHYDVCEERDITPPPSARGVGQLLGTWQFTHIIDGARNTDEWTLTSIRTLSGITAAVGSTNSGHPILGVRVEDLGLGQTFPVEYAVYWEPGLWCKIYAFNLTSSTQASGIYAFARKSGGSCGAFSQDYPATGTRIRAASQLSYVVPQGQDRETVFLLDNMADALDRIDTGILAARTAASPLANEDAYNTAFCASVGGTREVRHDYTYPTGESYVVVDCETDTMVYKGGLDKRSSLDSVQQALFFASLTGKQAAVVIYDTDGQIGRYEHRIRVASELAGVLFLTGP